jgi:hypothetical protein
MKTNRLLLIVIMAILLSSYVAALGVSPGRYTLDFKSNEEYSLSFNILNDQNKDIKVLLAVEGDAENVSIFLKEQVIELKSDEQRKTIDYKVKLPKQFATPGTKEIRFVITQLPDEKSDSPVTVGALIGVITQLRIKVPEQGKYLQVEPMEVSEAQSGEYVNFLIPVSNTGTEKIGKVKANVTILGPTNEPIATVQTQEEPLDPMKRTILKAVWPANVNSGKYFAVANIEYDSQKTRVEKVFSVGKASIEIVSIDTKNFQLGGIAKMDVKVKSNWNENLDVYGELTVKNEQMDEIAKVKTATMQVESNSESLLNAYWDTAGVKEGKYLMSLKLFFDKDKSIEKLFDMFLSLNSMSISPFGMTGNVIAGASSNKGLLIVLVIVLIIINVGWFWYMRKRKQ